MATLKKIIISQAAFKELLTKPVPVQTAFKLIKTAEKLEADLQTYEVLRLDLCQKYGKLNAEKKNLRIYFNGRSAIVLRRTQRASGNRNRNHEDQLARFRRNHRCAVFIVEFRLAD